MDTVSNNASKNSNLSLDMPTLLADTDRCVACGLCLSSCPTYIATHKETHSPRGRILLINGLTSNKLQANKTLSSHLEQCLHCGNCERVCPARVPYGHIIDRAKAILLKQSILTPLPGWLKYLLSVPILHDALGFIIKIWQQHSLQKLARRYRLLRWKKLAALEAMLPPAIDTKESTSTTDRGEICLFSGCIGNLAERPTLMAARYLLKSCGYRVTNSSSQVCCGALYQHNGMIERARECMQYNINIFRNKPIISCASGCSAHWRNFAPDSPHDDINDFLLKHNKLTFNELDTTVALHTPCTAKTAFKQPNAPLELLKKIPKLVVKTLPDETGCCGAGGIHLLRSSTTSTTLAREKIKALLASKANILLTTNTGCAMHLRRNLYLQGIDIPILHPTVLLYQQHRRLDGT